MVAAAVVVFVTSVVGAFEVVGAAVVGAGFVVALPPPFEPPVEPPEQLIGFGPGAWYEV